MPKKGNQFTANLNRYLEDVEKSTGEFFTIESGYDNRGKDGPVYYWLLDCSDDLDHGEACPHSGSLDGHTYGFYGLQYRDFKGYLQGFSDAIKWYKKNMVQDENSRDDQESLEFLERNPIHRKNEGKPPWE